MNKKFAYLMLAGTILSVPISFALGIPKDTLLVDNYPWKIFSDEDDSLAYVILDNGKFINREANSISIIDTQKYEVLKTTKFEGELYFFTIDTLRNTAYGFNKTSESMFWYDIITENFGDIVYKNQTKVNGIPFFDKFNQNVFGIALHENSNKTNQFLKIDQKTHEVTQIVPIADGLKLTSTNFNSKNSYFIDTAKNNLIAVDMKDFKVSEVISLPEIDLENLRDFYSNPENSRFILVYQNRIDVIDSIEKNLIVSINNKMRADLPFIIHKNVLYTINYQDHQPQIRYGIFQAHNLTSGDLEYKIKLGSSASHMDLNRDTGTFFVVNAYSSSISIIDDNTQHLISTPASFRYEIGVGVFVSIIFAILFVAETKQISRRMFIASILMVLSLLVLWIFNFQIYKHEALYGWALILGSTYSATYLLFLIIHYPIFRKGFLEIVYKFPKKKLDYLIKPYPNTVTDAIKYIMLAGIIAFPSIYFLSSFPLTLFLDVSPIPKISIFELFIEDESKSALETVFPLGYFIPTLIGFSFGPLWGFILRLIRFEELTSVSYKKKGSRSLLLYLYAVYSFLIIQGYFAIQIIDVNENSVFSDLIGMDLYDTLSLFTIISCVLAVFIYIIQRIILPKHNIYSRKIIEKKQDLFTKENLEKLVKIKRLIFKNILLLE